MQQFRRASDHVAEGSKSLTTEHISVIIPKDASRDEMVELAYQLLALAKEDSAEKLLTV